MVKGGPNGAGPTIAALAAATGGLYQPADLPRPMRLQGVFVSDPEIGRVVEVGRAPVVVITIGSDGSSRGSPASVTQRA